MDSIQTYLTGLTGLEPATSAVTGRCSNQLNYSPITLHFSNYAYCMSVCQAFFGISYLLVDGHRAWGMGEPVRDFTHSRVMGQEEGGKGKGERGKYFFFLTQNPKPFPPHEIAQCPLNNCHCPITQSAALMSDAAIYGIAFFYTLVLRGFYSTGAKMRGVSFDYVLPRFSTFAAELDRCDY